MLASIMTRVLTCITFCFCSAFAFLLSTEKKKKNDWFVLWFQVYILYHVINRCCKSRWRKKQFTSSLCGIAPTIDFLGLHYVSLEMGWIFVMIWLWETVCLLHNINACSTTTTNAYSTTITSAYSTTTTSAYFTTITTACSTTITNACSPASCSMWMPQMRLQNQPTSRKETVKSWHTPANRLMQHAPPLPLSRAGIRTLPQPHSTIRPLIAVPGNQSVIHFYTVCKACHMTGWAKLGNLCVVQRLQMNIPEWAILVMTKALRRLQRESTE